MNYISKYLVFITLCCTQSIFGDAPFLDASAKHGKKIVMINPAGHAGDAGRKLKNSYERAETIKMAQYIQERLESKNDNLRVVLTRTPGETVVDFQNASFANRLSVDLFLSLHFYASERPKHEIYIYYYVADPIADFARRNTPELSFIPVMQAHQFNIYKTRHIAERLQSSISGSLNRETFEFVDLLGIPVKPLLGIASPAILFEIGWSQGDTSSWKDAADCLIDGVDEIL
ncbi:MAG: hypothetical protein US49_C0005G0033 [candidate division TM6 bacterium GW2011_GWF2_37_49]|nr:MAG: hypothetical protein US49_C0005G0033 [candidate division TM6 bacterium GW2011_GWF2_37_49]